MSDEAAGGLFSRDNVLALSLEEMQAIRDALRLEPGTDRPPQGRFGLGRPSTRRMRSWKCWPRPGPSTANTKSSRRTSSTLNAETGTSATSIPEPLQDLHPGLNGGKIRQAMGAGDICLSVFKDNGWRYPLHRRAPPLRQGGDPQLPLGPGPLRRRAHRHRRREPRPHGHGHGREPASATRMCSALPPPSTTSPLPPQPAASAAA